MDKLDRSSLWSLEQYAEQRPTFRATVIAHKKSRRIAVGPHATLCFEDALTMRYQVQEMLRTERIFEAADIEAELSAYNPLIPDGGNWKATFLIEYPDADERHRALASLGGVEHTLWTRVGDHDKVFAVANEDMERSTDGKAAAVHFLRFELPATSRQAAKTGAPIVFGIDHERLKGSVTLADAARLSLVADLD
jgi:hypothetical protein